MNISSDVTSINLLDSELQLRLMMRRIATDSANAIMDLWDKERGCFWRDTDQRKKKSNDRREFFPTVTYRSTEALLDLFFRHPDWLPEKRRETLEHLPKIFSRSFMGTTSALDSSTSSHRNPFTTALYLISAHRANRLAKSELVQSENIESAKTALFAGCLDSESPYFERHPFIEFHVIRAITALWPKRLGSIPKEALNLRDQVVTNIKKLTEKLLSKRVLEQLAPSDCVALIFCAATLAVEDSSENRQYVLPALEVGFQAQDSSGCWPLGRILRQSRSQHGQRATDFTISTYEIAWAASEALLKLFRYPQVTAESRTLAILDGLLSAGRYAERSSIELSGYDRPKRGWCSDPPYGWLLVESWTSANVLQSIISLTELIDERICNQTLRSFVFLDPRSKDWPSWKAWEQLKKHGEPEDDNPIFDYLDRKVVKKIKNNPLKLPASKEETVSILLFGPPGTSKTTVVHALAHGLGWPIVMLSPGDFIEKGLEFIEAQARNVFDRLHRLHRVVVLFDECDELFRERPQTPAEPMRNITAFVTASMLPKLQDLHDRGRVVFCICTNKFGTLDPAVKRGGRIDHIVAIGPPQQKCRERIITEALSSIQGDKAIPIEGLAVGTDQFVRREIIRACDVVKSEVGDWNDTEKVKHAVSTAVGRMRQSLMISQKEYEDFKADQRQYSHPVIEKAQQ